MEIWNEYPEVYHYTNFSTALLILHSTKLRATRHDLLNDTEEIIYSKKIIVEKYHEKFPNTPYEKVKSIIEAFFSPVLAMGNFYITSFCGKKTDTNSYHHENGLLSMWRYYGADGGCAIAFKTQNIYENTRKYREPIENNGYGMDKVIYKGENDQDPDYNDRLNRFIQKARKLESNLKNNPNFTMEAKGPDLDEVKKILEVLSHLMICSKHPAFVEEREVRVGLCFFSEQDKGQVSSPQQFHEIPFSPVQDISRIIIGPHKDQKERYNFLKSYLSKRDLNIEVAKSEIPLRF